MTEMLTSCILHCSIMYLKLRLCISKSDYVSQTSILPLKIYLVFRFHISNIDRVSQTSIVYLKLRFHISNIDRVSQTSIVYLEHVVFIHVSYTNMLSMSSIMYEARVRACPMLMHRCMCAYVYVYVGGDMCLCAHIHIGR